ncbi:MAG: acetate--CoA ligase [Bacteroidetes bacterium 43-16]|nr:MAG: acetate--CoA ligase [Bacteroidetes bacterium 43-16]
MSYPYQIQSYEQYRSVYAESIHHPEAFWAGVAGHFSWHKKWEQVLEWDFKTAHIAWFKGAQLNVAENCLDRHLAAKGDQPALIWEPNDPEDASRTLTYTELHHKVMQFAHVLKNNGVSKGDRVCIYMGMIPELVIAMLACARIGAVHSVIFGGFSAQSIADRIQDAEANTVITCDGAYRGNKVIPLKSTIDDALPFCPSVKKVIVCTHTRTPVSMLKGRDIWWEDEVALVAEQGNPYIAPESMDAEDTLFILYTSGSTGKPKGVVHTTAGYLVWANYTFVNVFQYRQGDVHFCTADIGWITGHTSVVYGPLSAGATTLMYEGIPTWPDAGRLWEIVEKHKATTLFTAPTAIRSLMGFNTEFLKDKDLSSLKTLGTAGEPINSEAWHWFHKNAGKSSIPLVDTWWQTETGGPMIGSLSGVTPTKVSCATLPMPGIQPVLVDEQGHILEGNDVSGNLCIKFPWPGMLRTTYGDHERFRQTYFSTYENMYFTGDGCMRDEEGFYKITGRVDDVLNVSGHRLGTAEVENAINMHLGVVESAIVGYPHDVKGEGIYAYIVYKGHEDEDNLTRQDIALTVSRIIGPIAKPDKIQFVRDLPKTRSGKIMRRILRKIAEGELNQLGDTSTLLDPTVVEEIKSGRL